MTTVFGRKYKHDILIQRTLWGELVA